MQKEHQGALWAEIKMVLPDILCVLQNVRFFVCLVAEDIILLENSPDQECRGGYQKNHSLQIHWPIGRKTTYAHFTMV